MAVAVPLIAAGAAYGASAGIGAAIAGTAFAAALGATGTAIFTGLVGAVVSFGVSSALGSALGGSKNKSIGASGAGGGRTLQVRAPLTAHRFILGQAKVSGPIVFLHARDADGKPNQFLHMVHVLAAHRIDGLGRIYLDQDLISEAKFRNLVTYEWKRGLSDQGALDQLAAQVPEKWTSAHRARGRAVMGTRFKYDDSTFPNGVPNVAAEVRGLPVFDPRVNTTLWSDNWANHVAAYIQRLPSFRNGQQVIDVASWIEAANISDEPVQLRGGGSERRYTVNGTYDADEDPDVVLQRLVDAGAGMVVEAGGVWFIHAGAWRPATRTLGPDDLRGEVQARLNRPARDLANGVRATFIRPEANWQPVDAPVLRDAAAVARDGGAEVYADLELPFTASAATAQRLMRIWLQRNRAGLELTLPCTLSAFSCRPGDTVEVDLEWLPERFFRVMSWSMDDDAAGVTLTLAAERPEFYSWSPQTDEAILAPVPGVVAPGSITTTLPILTATPPTTAAITTQDVSWTPVAGATDYQIEFWSGGPVVWTSTTTASTSASVATGGPAAFRVRARSPSGPSDWDQAPFVPPLSRVSATGITGGVRVEWSAAPGTDRVQVFTGSTNVFASATKAPTDPTSYPVDVTGLTGTVYVWARAVTARGVVTGPTGPVQVEVAVDQSAAAENTGSNGEGGGGGSSEGSNGEGGSGFGGDATSGASGGGAEG